MTNDTIVSMQFPDSDASDCDYEEIEENRRRQVDLHSEVMMELRSRSPRERYLEGIGVYSEFWQRRMAELELYRDRYGCLAESVGSWVSICGEVTTWTACNRNVFSPTIFFLPTFLPTPPSLALTFALPKSLVVRFGELGSKFFKS